jgi:hypothetical protein
MDIIWDQSGDGPPSCVMAARSCTRTGLPVRVMRGGRCIAIRGVMLVAAASCAGLLAGLAAVAPAAGSVSRGSGALAVPGAQLWASTYNGPGNNIDAATAVAASPAGGAVFVTGASWGLISGPDYATVAYDAVTGAQLWASRYEGPEGGDQAAAVAVSPGGRAVFVTGKSAGTGGFFDYVTVAYDAATGARLWVRRYDGPGHRKDVASAVAVSPGGGTVFVTGTSAGRASGLDYATVAYDAATGAQRWVSRYNGPGNGGDQARAVVAGPGGHAVYVTGESSSATGVGYATVSYSAATGAQRWVRVSRHNGSGGTSVAASPDGHAVYVTGGADAGYRTIAYNAATGARLWARKYYAINEGVSVAASPDGHAVYVTGTSVGAFGTVAYDAATGAQLWTARFDRSGAAALAVGPAGQVYVTGFTVAGGDDYATVGYQG